MCNEIEDVRSNIDRIDNEIVKLICQREQYVKQAGKLKTSSDAVKAPDRVKQVITKVRSIAQEEGGNTDIVEKVYRTMIESFISMEMDEYKTK